MDKFRSVASCGMALALALVAGVCGKSVAQSVIFPQPEQPGQAVLTMVSDGGFELGNDLFMASFVPKGGSLVFGGCDAMDLIPGSELFSVTFANGVTVNASEMEMSSARAMRYKGDPEAARGSERFDGWALVADFTVDNLDIRWRAVLRDGSHYLRTEMELTAKSDVAMQAVTPMIYEVATGNGVSAPVVVGNTRGAILASDNLFAGVESPMGINTASGSAQAASFTYNSWTPESFSWAPGDDTPAGVKALGFDSSDIVGAKGYLVFREAGANKITFEYRSGTHRLNIVGVDVVDLDSKKVVASDYHVGYTGGAKANNVYTLAIPESGAYMLRYFMETRTETITSSGSISFDKKVTVPEIVYGDAPARAPRKVVADGTAMADGSAITDNWNPSMWRQVSQNEFPARIGELGYVAADVKSISRRINFAETGKFSAEFVYSSGNCGLSIVGMDLIDDAGNVVTSDYHKGFSGNLKENNVYSFQVPYAGEMTVRYFCENKTEENVSSGNINLSLATHYVVYVPVEGTTPIEGRWSRNTTLAAGKTWTISAVAGIIAPGQARRSVLAYSERERAVPWRAFPLYNSWYELNIDRNNAAPPTYTGNMTVDQCVDVVGQWRKNLYDAHGANIAAFVWDDGWDEYGTWTFNCNFPNGFKEPNEAATAMNTGIGGWLGPVGGYGASGNYRRQYWNGKGGMQLSNPAYYKVFLDACSNLVNDYDFRFFKFDGISAQFSSVGPDAGTVGEENAEGIIDLEQQVRKIKPDIFLNTTVGTWASPFWFRFTDAVWRQEADYGTIGNQGTDRERWITYRDRLVYQNFVQNSPLCPINTLMTHGVILTRKGAVATDMGYDGIVRELRCAFACGSGMVELYCDYAALNGINGGALWGDIAECIKWQERNADVLPDAHWVGGNPWDGSRANVYGWASWNGDKSTLALRNPAASAASFTFTLREALDIPDYFTGSIILSPSFEKQDELSGLTVGEPVDIDAVITVNMPRSSVFVFDGIDSDKVSIESVDAVDDVKPAPSTGCFDLMGRPVANPSTGIYIVNGQKTIIR
ncbi:MAG: hypothetical protein K2L32_07780 [Muribaculaceae bacterium]|nr:hypothetical protein [Muribaculaceae bacterium]